MSIKLLDTLGLPPSTYISDNYMRNSLPVAEFTPGKPHFDEGINVFKILPTDEENQEYQKIVDMHGYSVSTPLRLAFLADNFPSDTFRNEYGSSMLERITGVVSEGAQSLAQTFGAETLTEGLENVSKFMQGEDSGRIMSMIGGGMQTGVNQIRGLQSRLEDGGMGDASDMMDRVLAGARIDFPQIWKGSGFVPSYTMTVRLFNPHPGSAEATDKYIVGPLAAIMALGLPRTEDEGTYQWPFFHRIKCRGMFILNPAVITNITVVKGGDQHQIAFSQRLSIVDVRIEVSGLFQTMLMDSNPDEGITSDPERPTLSQYLENLKDGREVENIYNTPNQYNQGPQNLLASVAPMDEHPAYSGRTNFESRPSDEPSQRVSDKDKQKATNVGID